MKTQIYSKEMLISLLKEWVQANGEVPSKRQLNSDANMPSDMAYRKAFGSWGNALEACGYEVKKPFPSENCKIAVSKSKKGKRSSNWKGGIIKTNGYVKVWDSETQKYVFQHRKIVEESIGRKLTNSEDVHHINYNKEDNSIENLMLITKSEHSKLHESIDTQKHNRKNASKCIYPNCENKTSSKYHLCNKHYKAQWWKLKNGKIKNITDVEVIGTIFDEG
jgi:hypothetical protein